MNFLDVIFITYYTNDEVIKVYSPTLIAIIVVGKLLDNWIKNQFISYITRNYIDEHGKPPIYEPFSSSHELSVYSYISSETSYRIYSFRHWVFLLYYLKRAKYIYKRSEYPEFLL